MTSIQTAYLPPTNTKGLRIKVWAGDRTAKIYSRESFHAQGDEARHFEAVQRYCKDSGFKWTGELVCGGTREGYVFVFAKHSNGADTDRFTLTSEGC